MFKLNSMLIDKKYYSDKRSKRRRGNCAVGNHLCLFLGQTAHHQADQTYVSLPSKAES